MDTIVGLVLPRPNDDPLISAFNAAGGTTVELDGPSGNGQMANLCAKSNLILDGVFGFSISWPIGEPVASLFEIAKNSGKRTVAIDMPSGADPDTGEFDPNGLPTDVCLSVGLHKLGPAIRFGDPHFGTEMEVLDVDVPSELIQSYEREVNDFALARTLLPDRNATAHKGRLRTFAAHLRIEHIRRRRIARNASLRKVRCRIGLARNTHKRVPGTSRERARSDIHTVGGRRQRSSTGSPRSRNFNNTSRMSIQFSSELDFPCLAVPES